MISEGNYLKLPQLTRNMLVSYLQMHAQAQQPQNTKNMTATIMKQKVRLLSDYAHGRGFGEAICIKVEVEKWIIELFKVSAHGDDTPQLGMPEIEQKLFA